MSNKGKGLFIRIKNGIRGEAVYEKTFKEFARSHDLVYFDSFGIDHGELPTVRGSTASRDHTDHHYCIGTHLGYDMNLIDRTSAITFEGYASKKKRWYILQIDLRSVKNLPYIFIGTKQQTKAYYARVLSANRELRYLSLLSSSKKNAAFHATYAVLASPSQTPLLYRLFDVDTIDSMGSHRYPFALEIEGDTLTIITEATKTNQQLLDKLLHYGIWFAKRIDERLG